MRSYQQQPSTLGIAFRMERHVSVQSSEVGSCMVYCVQRAKEGGWAGVRLPGEKGLGEEGEGCRLRSGSSRWPWSRTGSRWEATGGAAGRHLI